MDSEVGALTDGGQSTRSGETDGPALRVRPECTEGVAGVGAQDAGQCFCSGCPNAEVLIARGLFDERCHRSICRSRSGRDRGEPEVWSGKCVPDGLPSLDAGEGRGDEQCWTCHLRNGVRAGGEGDLAGVRSAGRDQGAEGE